MSRSPVLVTAVALAGALGALARDALDRVVGGRLPDARLPVGILVVNVLGSFLLGVLVGAPGSHDQIRLVAGGGFLGAFTTFSTFAVQTVRLGRTGGMANVLAHMAGCLGAVTVGIALGGRL